MMLKCLFWTAYLIPLIYSFNLNPSIKQYFIKPFATLFVTSSLATNSVNQVNQFMNHNNPSVVHAAEKQALEYLGSYSDPNHPGCKRLITYENSQVIVSGSDNLDGSSPWTLTAKREPDGSLMIDFSPKGGPKDLKAVYNEARKGLAVRIFSF